MSTPFDLNKMICSGEALEKLNAFRQLLIPYLTQDLEVKDLEKTAELGSISLSKEYILDKEAPAILVHQAVRNLLSDKVINYEPETIWLELERLGIDVPEENRNKIVMVNAIHVTDPIVYDVHVFKNMVMTFNNELPNLEMTEEAEPEHVAWTILNLQFLHPEQPIYMDYEPRIYTAAVLHRNGFILAPETLSFAQEELDKLNSNIELKEDIQKDLDNNKLTHTNKIIENQLIKISRVTEYLKLRYADYKEKLGLLLEPEKIGEKVAKILKEKEKLTDRKTSLVVPEIEVGFGSVRGDEKSGVEDPAGHGVINDFIPPVFILNAEGA